MKVIGEENGAEATVTIIISSKRGRRGYGIDVDERMRSLPLHVKIQQEFAA